MSIGLPRPISDHSRLCLKRFYLIKNEVRTPNSLGHNLSPSMVSDETERFKTWAGNIGAIHDPGRQDTSLDLRLKEAPDIAGQVLEFLVSLAQDLDSVLQIASGRRANRVGPLETYEESDNGDEFSGEADMIVEDVSEIHELFETCQHCISCIFRLSIAIRKATSRDRYASSFRKREDPFNELFDIAHVGQKFPKLHEVPWLETRLGRAITRRREFIRYSREHSGRLARGTQRFEQEHFEQPKVTRTPLQDEIISRTPPTELVSKPRLSTLGSTKATTLDVAQLKIPVAVVDEEAREPSRATTEVPAENEGDLRVPKLPDIGKGGREFDCPYCWTNQCFRGKGGQKQWEKHVLHDLRPYVCTFPNCDLAMYSDSDAWFQHELDDHHLEWSCQLCSHQPVDSAEKYEVHLQKSHKDLLGRMNMNTFVQSAKRSVKAINLSSCPFCDPPLGEEHLLLETSSFKAHVTRHMEQLALFAIPRVSDVGEQSFTSTRAALPAPNVDDRLEVENAVADKELQDLPLHFAAYEGRGVEVKRLLQSGQDIDIVGKTWGTPLGAAVAGKRLAIIKLLLENGAEVQLPCGNHENALKAAASIKNPTLEKIVAEAWDRNQRPALYGEIKWKIESIATKLDSLSSKFSQRTCLLREGGAADSEMFSWMSDMISESLRPISSDLDPNSETQGMTLQYTIHVIPILLRGLETLVDILELVHGNFWMNAADYNSLSPQDSHKISCFNETILEVLRHIECEKLFFHIKETISLGDFMSNIHSIVDKVGSSIKKSRIHMRPRAQDPTSWKEEFLAIQAFLTRSHEVLSKHLQDAKTNREERLRYFDTYPDDPDFYHHAVRRQGAEYLSDLAERRARYAEIDKLESQKPQHTQERLPVQLPEPLSGGPATTGRHESSKVRQDVQSTKVQSVNELKAQSTEDSTNAQASTQNKISEEDLARLIDFANEFKKKIVDVTDEQFGFAKSIQSTVSALTEQVGQDPASTLDFNLNILGSAHTMFRSELDDKITEAIKLSQEKGLSEDPTEAELLQMEAELKQQFLPLQVVSRILTDAVSDASAEKPGEEVLPSWKAVTEFFEWKAGYSFDDCLADCAVLCSEIILHAVLEDTSNKDRGLLARPDPDAPVRLNRMIEHFKLFDPNAME